MQSNLKYEGESNKNISGKLDIEIEKWMRQIEKII